MQKFNLSLALIVLAMTSGCGDKNKTPEVKDQTGAVTTTTDNKELNDNIAKLIKAYKVRDNVTKFFDASVEQLKVEHGLDDAAAKGINTKLSTMVNSDEYLKAITAIYAKHLNNDDVLALTAFFSTATGQKWIEAHQIIFMETMQYSMQSGQPAVIEAMQAKAAKAAVPATSKPTSSAKQVK